MSERNIPNMRRHTLKVICASLAVLVAASLQPFTAFAAGKKPMNHFNGNWSFGDQADGVALRFIEGKAAQEDGFMVLHVLCTDGNVRMSTFLVLDGGFEAAQKLVDQKIPMTVAIGNARFTYDGNVYDGPDGIAVEMAAPTQDPMFSTMISSANAKGARMSISSAKGGYTIPLKGADKQVGAWLDRCRTWTPSQ
jgi:hypothetical protein